VLLGGQHSKGEQVYEEMHTMCKPDGATYNIMAMLYCRLGKCREAVNFMEAMLRGGHTVELTAFDAVIDTAWSSGVLSLQRYAVQLFERARPCGHYTVLIQDKVCNPSKLHGVLWLVVV
jgi:pentatricopeptide repeat protein